jgi:hypothetical protein
MVLLESEKVKEHRLKPVIFLIDCQTRQILGPEFCVRRLPGLFEFKPHHACRACFALPLQ